MVNTPIFFGVNFLLRHKMALRSASPTVNEESHDTLYPCHTPHSRAHAYSPRSLFCALQLLNAGNFCVHTLSMDSDSVQPAWALYIGLKRSGLYYEGFVDNLEDTMAASPVYIFKVVNESRLHHHWHLYTYGTRTSRKSAATTVVPSSNRDRENDS